MHDGSSSRLRERSIHRFPRNSFIETIAGLAITSFRLASTQRRFDRSQSKWVDAETNWYTITTFRQLAFNAVASINKGDRIVVGGRLRIRDWQNGEKSGTNIDVEADALGHDLSWGTSTWVRTTATAAQTESPESSEEFPSSADLPEAQSDAALAPGDRPSDDGALIPATTDDVPVPF